MDSVKVTVGSQSVTVDYTVNTPVPPTTNTLFGQSTPSLPTLATARSRGYHTFRIFYSGNLPVTFNGDDRLATMTTADTVIISYKSGTPTQFLKTVPDNMKNNVIMCYRHEPENDTDTATSAGQKAYRDAAATQNGLIHAQGFKTSLILMGWTSEKPSGRDYKNYLATGTVDYLFWDAYNSGNKGGTYETPEHILAGILDIAAESGLPWGITETGSKDFGTINGQNRAQWTAAFAAAIKAGKGTHAIWWDQANGAFDVKLDAASAAAWR